MRHGRFTDARLRRRGDPVLSDLGTGRLPPLKFCAGLRAQRHRDRRDFA
jgi:hypothetical protein